jgi:hypothetical protein
VAAGWAPVEAASIGRDLRPETAVQGRRAHRLAAGTQWDQWPRRSPEDVGRHVLSRKT